MTTKNLAIKREFIERHCNSNCMSDRESKKVQSLCFQPIMTEHAILMSSSIAIRSEVWSRNGVGAFAKFSGVIGEQILSKS